MEFVKTAGRYVAVNPDGTAAAYIERNYIGTHGHYKGWNHMVWDAGRRRFVQPSILDFQKDGLPSVFRNVLEFQSYYANN